MMNQIKKYAETYQIKNCDTINMQEKQSNFFQYQVEIMKKNSAFSKMNSRHYIINLRKYSKRSIKHQVNLVYFNDYVLMKEYHRINANSMIILHKLQIKQLDKFKYH